MKCVAAATTTRTPRARQQLDAAYRSENPPMRAGSNSDYYYYDNYDTDKEVMDNSNIADAGEVDVNDRRERTLCPFDGSLTCTTGCMLCGDGAKCCSQGETCTVPVTAETPCPYSSTMATCMMCDNAKGEPTLVSAKPGDTCSATTFCSAFGGQPDVYVPLVREPIRPSQQLSASARGRSLPPPPSLSSSLQQQQQQLLKLQARGDVGSSGPLAAAAARGMSFAVGNFGGVGSMGGMGGGAFLFHRSPQTLTYAHAPLAAAMMAKPVAAAAAASHPRPRRYRRY